MLNLINNIKSYLIGIFVAVIALLTALFLYERRKVEVDDAILGEKKVDSDLAKTDALISQNNETLKQQETDRAKLENEKPNEDNTATIIDNFNKLK